MLLHATLCCPAPCAAPWLPPAAACCCPLPLLTVLVVVVVVQVIEETSHEAGGGGGLGGRQRAARSQLPVKCLQHGGKGCQVSTQGVVGAVPACGEGGRGQAGRGQLVAAGGASEGCVG